MALPNRPNHDPEWFSTGSEAPTRQTISLSFLFILILDFFIFVAILSSARPLDKEMPSQQVSKKADATAYCSIGPPYSGGASNGGPPPGDNFKPC